MDEPSPSQFPFPSQFSISWGMEMLLNVISINVLLGTYTTNVHNSKKIHTKYAIKKIIKVKKEKQ